MRIPLLVSVLVLAAACADTRPVPYEKLTQENEINGFRIAVVDVCLQSAMAGTPVSDLASETGPIVAAGADMWAPREAEGVLIRASGKTCEVTTKGPLTRASLDAVDKALNDPHGFVVETPAEPKGSNVLKRYSKKVGAQTFHVTMAGSAPLADAAPGALIATVTATPFA